MCTSVWSKPYHATCTIHHQTLTPAASVTVSEQGGFWPARWNDAQSNQHHVLICTLCMYVHVYKHVQCTFCMLTPG